jgi:hypothetical protein
MKGRTLLPVLAAAGFVLALSGCTAVYSDRSPGPRAGVWVWGQPGYRLMLIGDTGVHYVADCDEDIYVHEGVWYRYRAGVWYSCRSNGGQWVAVRTPPPAFSRIPPGHAKYRPVGPKGPEHEPKGPPPGRGRDSDDDKPGPGRGPKWK